MNIDDPEKLFQRLRELPRETEWVEFKLNLNNPDEIGEYVSGLANSAILKRQDRAYLVFGIEDKTHAVKGTKVRLKELSVGNEVFEHWLSRLLTPRIDFEFINFDVDQKHIEMIAINPAYLQPVRFKNEAFIRVDSVQKKLKDYPERERALWSITSRFSFEEGVAATHLFANDVLQKFRAEALLKKLGNGPLSDTGVIDQLLLEGLIKDDMQGGFDVTNLFALVAARDFSSFPSISAKAPRVIFYKDKTKLTGVDDVTGKRGYGISFRNLLSYIMERIPHREQMEHGVRKTVYEIPEIAVREIVANSLIHQDLTASGSGPRIEIFKDRIKVTNPGEPLISTDRFIDAPAKSRNEKLAGLMRRLGLCEERGSGIDRALDAIESAGLPPPLFQQTEESTVVTLFGERSFADMTKEERIRACYQHASLRFESGSPMSNSTLRARFKLSDKQYPQVSNVIREAIEEGLIRPQDEDQSKRNARYLPFWA